MGSNVLDTLHKSFRYIMKRSGLKIDPWVTPQIISRLDVFIALPCINCFLFERVPEKHLRLLFFMPHKFSLSMRILWSTVSKAFDKFIKTPNVYLTRALSVKWPFLKPYCLWKRRLLLSGNYKLGCSLENFRETRKYGNWPIVC